MEVVFRQENTAAVFGDKWVCMGELSAGFIHLEARPARQKHRRNAAMIESGRKFVEPWDGLSMRRNQVVDSDIENEGSLAQKALRLFERSILAEIAWNPWIACKKTLEATVTRGEKKKAGRNPCPLCAAASLAESAERAAVAVYFPEPEVVEALACCEFAFGMLT
jgi:hypothetical protein